ncbi:MAG: hypothetical protein VX341_02360 [Bdellovibrionota bacterium]|nr:hypothetical protein [Bdellovibrionota bacterium]
MRKSFVALVILLISSSAFASQLMAHVEIYELSEAIHSARYDYEGGVSFKLMPSYDILAIEELSKDSEGPSDKSRLCKQVNDQELIKELEVIANIHLLNFEEDSEIVFEGLSKLSGFLSGKQLSRCFDKEMNSYISYQGNFLYSLNGLRSFN